MGVLASGRRVLAVGAQQQGAPANTARVRSIDTPVLRIGFEESGSPQGFPIFLLHGFPDKISRAFRPVGGNNDPASGNRVFS